MLNGIWPITPISPAGSPKAGFQSAKEHFVRWGYFEVRLPRELSLDEAWHLSSNPDATEGGAYGGKGPKERYIEHCHRERRWPIEPPGYLPDHDSSGCVERGH
jgi:hypothetical protein